MHKWLWVTCLTFICWLSIHGYTWSTRCIQESIIDHLPWYFTLWIIENMLWPLCGILFHLLTSSYSATVPKLAKTTAPIFKAAKNVNFQDWIGKWCSYLIHKVGVWLSANFAVASRNTQCACFSISSSSLVCPFTFTSCSYRACSIYQKATYCITTQILE